MDRPSALRLVHMLGRTLAYRDAVALVTFLAHDSGWDAASTLADALDLDEPTQEKIYKRAVEKR